MEWNDDNSYWAGVATAVVIVFVFALIITLILSGCSVMNEQPIPGDIYMYCDTINCDTIFIWVPKQ